jgi:acetylglutamate synthase
MTVKRKSLSEDDGLRIGDFIAVIAGRSISLHRIIKVGWTTIHLRYSPRPIKFYRETWREAGSKGWRKAYKPTDHELKILRTEIQCAALLKEAAHLNDQISALIRKAGCLPSDRKLATLRSVILYMNRALKRTNALLPHAEVRHFHQTNGDQRND